MSIWEYANPVKFIRMPDKVLPWLSGLALLLLVGGIDLGVLLYTG